MHKKYKKLRPSKAYKALKVKLHKNGLNSAFN